MNRFFRLALLFVVALCQCAVTGMCQTGKPPTHIIFDTDMGGDCNDVGAAVMFCICFMPPRFSAGARP